MFYIMYLTSLCQRRSWPEPQFAPFSHRDGHGCIVRVNNREYSTGETAYGTEELARNAAATQAYMICRNFSVNDGMIPGQRPSSESGCQGLPVAIGTGRKLPQQQRTPSTDSDEYPVSPTKSTLSERDSPLLGAQRSPVTEKPPVLPSVAGARYGSRARGGTHLCFCRRAHATASGRCAYCLRDANYTLASP